MNKRLAVSLVPMISLVLALVLLFVSVPVEAQKADAIDSQPFVSSIGKIDSTLYKTAKQKDGKYLVCILNESIPTNTLHETIKKETRFDVSLYETDRFDSCIVPEIERQIESSEKMNRIQIPLTELVLGEPTPITLKQATQKEMDAYTKAKREVIKALNTEKNDLYVETYISNKSDVLFQSRYTAMIFAYLRKEDIEKCAQSEETVRIMACPEIKPIVDDDTIDLVDQNIQRSSNVSGDTLFDQINRVDTYQGDGITIGVVEWGKYDATHPQLAGLPETRLEYVGNLTYNGNAVTDIYDRHATYVTALIVGKSVVINGKTYTGIMPNAKVYQTAIENSESGILESIELLLDCNVSVINCSAACTESYEVTTSYDLYDTYVDNLLAEANATFVVAAGNMGPLPNSPSTEPAYVVTPAKTYNSITVGNAKTNDLDGTPLNRPYVVYSTSSYEVEDYLTNKPDISAPGFSIRMPFVRNNGTVGVDYIHGTSYAAPLVTGAVAQLHQANASLESNPTATKAVLLAGADFDAISGEDNDLWDYCYAARVKSGVGFLNAERAVRIAEAGNYDYNVYFLNLTSRYVEQSIVCEEVYIPANHKIRMVMTYSKPAGITDVETFANGNDMDLDLFYQDRSWCDSSLTPYNNVEVIEYVVDTAGTYSIEVYVPKLTQSRLGVVIHRTVAWCIEPVS